MVIKGPTMQPQNDPQNTPTPSVDQNTPTFSPNDPQLSSSTGQFSNQQDFTFQIPKTDPNPAPQIAPVETPPPAPNIQTPPIISSEPVPQIPDPVFPPVTQVPSTSPYNGSGTSTPMPDVHEPPIFMYEDSPAPTATPAVISPVAPSVPPIPPLASPPSYSLGGEPPQNQGIQPMQRPVQSAANLSQVTIPRRRKNSNLKYIVFGIIGFLIAGLLVWAVVAIISSVGSNSNKTSEQTIKKPENNKYENKLIGFATEYPKDWSAEQTKEDGLDVITFSHPKVRKNGTPTAEVAVIRLTSEQLKDIPDKKEFYSLYQKALIEGFDNYSERDSQELTVDGIPAKRIDADISKKGEQNQAVFHLIYAGQDGFVVVAYADKAQFKDLEDELELIIDKFDSKVKEIEPAKKEPESSAPAN